MSQTATRSASFTLTEARYLSSKVRADLRLTKLFYGSPTDQQIDDYGEEVALYLNAGYLDRVRFGFTRDEMWIPLTFEYTAAELADGTDNDPGKVFPGFNIYGARFATYLWPNDRYKHESPGVKGAFTATLPVSRSYGTEAPAYGTWTWDNVYCSAGTGLKRRTLS
jgi:Bacterial HORMA domain family 1